MPVPKVLSFISSGIKKMQNLGGFINNKVEMNRRLAFIQNVMEISPNPTFYKDDKGICCYCNLAFEEYLGLKKEEIIGYSILNICPKEFADVIFAADKRLINERSQETYKTLFKEKNGSVYDMVFKKDISLNNGNKVNGIVVSMTDITDITELVMSEKINKRTLNLNQAMLEINQIIIEKNDIIEICSLVLDKITSAIELADVGCFLVFDKEENLKIIASKGYDIEQSKKFSIKLTDCFYYKKNNGKIDKTIIINDIQKFDWNKYTDFWRRDHSEVQKAVLINEENNVDGIKCTRLLESSKAINVESSISTPIVFDGQLYGFINIDSTENNAFHESDLDVMNYIKYQIEVGISKYKIYEETIYLSRYDKLTKVYNRGYFEQLFDSSIKNAILKNNNFLMIIFDLNGLKIVNDTYGHLAGDELIKFFAYNLSAFIKNPNIFGRLGGDEFAAIVFDRELKVLHEELDSLNKTFIDKPLIFEGNKIICNFSFGVSEFPRNGLRYKELFKKADKNMYKYKRWIKDIS